MTMQAHTRIAGRGEVDTEKSGECPRVREHLGAAAEYLLRYRDQIFRTYLRKLLDAGQVTESLAVFVFSHTHEANPGFLPCEKRLSGWDPFDPGFLPCTKAQSDWNPLVVNTGAWQRIITPKQLNAWKDSKGITDDEQVLKRLDWDTLPVCYSAILIKPTTQRASDDELLYFWQETTPGKWEFLPWSLIPKCQ